MIRSVWRSTVQAAIALLVLSAIVFLMSRATGNPLFLLLPPNASQADLDAAAQRLGLDQPLPVQFGLFVVDAMQGDLGRSLRSGEQVTTIVGERLIASGGLALVAIVLAVGIGVPLGVLSALNRGKRVDSAIKLVALGGQSLPPFWVGILLVQIFAVYLGWLPSGGGTSLAHTILPGITLSLFGVAAIARLLRSSMLEILDSEFIKLARAKGLPERTVIWRHALRNSLLSVVSFTSVFFVNLLSAAIVVEVVFSWPGIGSLTYSAILNRDFPVIQAVALQAGAIAIIVSLIADLAYVWLDPRIRIGVARG